jgi:phosphoribosylformylglycinamidine synthase subunit PurSL
MSTTTASKSSVSSPDFADKPMVHRVEIHPTAHAGDPRGHALIENAKSIGVALEGAHWCRVYLIEACLTQAQLDQIIAGLLTNPVVEYAHVGASEPRGSLVEIHPLPGVMDPPAQSVSDAIFALIGVRAAVTTGDRYDILGISDAQAQTLANRLLANPVIAGVHAVPFHPEQLPHGHTHDFKITHVNIRDLDDAALEVLSREGHLFLALNEMQAIQSHYQTLGREPTDIELETLAQTWSEHCVHKTLKSIIHYTGDPTADVAPDSRPGVTMHNDGSYTIDNLLKSTVAAATFELIDEGLDWTLSVFVDNAGIIKFDDDHAVCIKVETHNHPSALAPYGGAATGIGGCIRDIIGTGLAAKPIASTDVFCVAYPDMPDIPAGCLPPKQILTEVVAGVRDYGNRMGIPTINGAVSFDNRYVGNPLVYCGCIGIMPIDLISGDAAPGDRIIALGGKTGRDGIHGATFSSAELTDTHADEFSHAVQIGNAIEEKRTLDAILRARDFEGGPLYRSITDCGAGGFSSAVGEMGEKTGAFVNLEQAPLKYAGLSYTEIWISEAQERMVLAVSEENLPALQKICDEEHVELADLGYFGTDNTELVLNFEGTEVGRLPMPFMHDGIPTPTRTATWTAPKQEPSASKDVPLKDALLTLLAHPNIASKHWIVRQYDHEVQGNTVIKPLVGPKGIGPGDASVVEPVPGSGQGLSVGCGLVTGLSDDPYTMTLAAIDECIRNLVCVGTDPSRIAILDNFCWPSCTKPENLGSLVRAAQACYDGAKAYKTPFVSGKDSLNNQFTTDTGETIEIPPTLLITGLGIVPDVNKCVTMDIKRVGNRLIHIEPQAIKPGSSFEDWRNNLTNLGGSHYAQCFGFPVGTSAKHPRFDIKSTAALAQAIHKALQSDLIVSAHDISDGGMICAVAEMLIAGSNDERRLGVDLPYDGFYGGAHSIGYWFGERPGGYILECTNPIETLVLIGELCDIPIAGNVISSPINESGTLNLLHQQDGSISVADLTTAWRSTLDW